jgi:hypothetical protein
MRTDAIDFTYFSISISTNDPSPVGATSNAHDIDAKVWTTPVFCFFLSLRYSVHSFTKSRQDPQLLRLRAQHAQTDARGRDACLRGRSEG